MSQSVDRFYSTVRDGSRVGWALGPFLTRTEAEEAIPWLTNDVEQHDPGAPWYAYGVSKIHDVVSAMPRGRLNERYAGNII